MWLICHLGFSLGGGGSIILWVNPLVLVSVLQVGGNLVSGLQELVVLVVGRWVSVQVLLGNSKGLELVNSVVVVGDLWEGERLLVDIVGVHLEGNIIEAILLEFLVDLSGGIEVLLAKSNTEFVLFLIHLIDESGLRPVSESRDIKQFRFDYGSGWLDEDRGPLMVTHDTVSEARSWPV